MNSYKQTIKYLFGLQSRGMKFGLRNTKELLKSVGNPERQFSSVHVAGTNGKGSTASFLASIFMEANYKTALYTSPHLIRFTERIRINGQEISESRLVSYAERLAPAIEKMNATFFEATTCIAFQYFADEHVEIAVIETGLGGRLDSTNVLHPLISIITNVSMDHTEYLGNTLHAIAREKGGIIKRNVPSITASTDRIVLSTLRTIAKRQSSRLHQTGKEVAIKVEKSHSRSMHVGFKSKHVSVSHVKLGLPGVHQISNAATAVAAIEILRRTREKPASVSRITNRIVKNGLERVTKNSGLHARLERFGRKNQFILDVAHNPAGIQALAASLTPRTRKNLIVVFGVMKDKDYLRMFETIGRIAQEVVAVKPRSLRALSSTEIAKGIRQLGTPAYDAHSVRNGILVAGRLAGKQRKILVTGSHYVVGEALELLQSKLVR